MPISYPGGAVAEHTAVRTAVGDLRRQPPRQGRRSPGRARRRSSTAASPRTSAKIGPGQAQYTLCCNDERRGHRRPDRLSGGPDERAARAERRQHRDVSRTLLRAAAPDGIRWSTGTASSRCSPSRGRGRRRCWSRRSGLARGAGLHGLRRRRDGDRGCAAPATPASTATSCSCPGTRRPRCGTRCSPRRARSAAAVRARRPRHPAHRDGLPPARPGPLAGDHARAGGQRLGGGLDKPEFWGRDALLAEKEAGPGAAVARAAGDGPRRPAAGDGVLDADGAAGRRDDVGDVLADAEGRDRPGADRHGRRCRRGRPGGGGRPRPAAARAPSSSRRSCPPTCADGPESDVTRTSDDSVGGTRYRLLHEPAVRPHRPPRPALPHAPARRRSWPRPGSAGTSPTTWSTIRWTPDRGWHDAAVVPYGPLDARPGDDGAALRAGDLRGAQGLPPARRLDRLVPARTRTPRGSAARRRGSAMAELPDELFLASLARAARRGPRVGARRRRRGRRCTCGRSCWPPRSGWACGRRPSTCTA